MGVAFGGRLSKHGWALQGDDGGTARTVFFSSGLCDCVIAPRGRNASMLLLRGIVKGDRTLGQILRT
jgi:hypothetical protein